MMPPSVSSLTTAHLTRRKLLMGVNSLSISTPSRVAARRGLKEAEGPFPVMNGKADASRWQEVVLGTKAAPAIDMDATAVPATSRVAVEN